jgi:hypothetical protein
MNAVKIETRSWVRMIIIFRTEVTRRACFIKVLMMIRFYGTFVLVKLLLSFLGAQAGPHSVSLKYCLPLQEFRYVLIPAL